MEEKNMSTDYEKLEEQYQKEHNLSGGQSNKPYNKQEYAKAMHEKELQEMSSNYAHMTSEEKRELRNSKIIFHRFDFAAYCRQYSEMLDAHEAAKPHVSV